MVPSEASTKIEMVSGSNGSRSHQLELKLTDINASNEHGTVDPNQINTKYVLEGLGLVADSDKAQVKSQLVNLRSQLDSLLSTLSQQ